MKLILSEEERLHIAKTLLSRCDNQIPCPMFHMAGLSLQKQLYLVSGFNVTPTGIDVNGRFQYIPVAVAVCENCGHLEQFSLKALGIEY